MKFSSLTTVELVEIKNSKEMWLCKCDCGNQTIVCASNLISKHTKSCGDRKNHPIYVKHGLCNTRLYNIYGKMKARCYKESCSGYESYGGREIKVCDEWMNDFMNFYNWSMANGYSDNLSLDRIDVNGNYEPSNCRWADWKTQENNRRNNKYISFNGETKTLSQWSDEIGISQDTLGARILSGWSIENALTTPLLKNQYGGLKNEFSNINKC